MIVVGLIRTGTSDSVKLCAGVPKAEALFGAFKHGPRCANLSLDGDTLILAAKGYITKQEYQDRRQALLNQL
jgi:hypothetical protein